MKKVKAHQRYTLRDGSVVPGVSTIVGTMGEGKEGLIRWNVKEASQGNDPIAMRNRQAEVGSVAHEMIRCYLMNEEFDGSEYAPAIYNDGAKYFESFKRWAKDHDITLVLVEQELVSEEYKYGGTLDLIVRLDGTLAILDHKTSGNIYPTHKVQIAAYQQLFDEALAPEYGPIERTIILQLKPRAAATPHEIMPGYFPYFHNLLKNWRLLYKLEKGD